MRKVIVLAMVASLVLALPAQSILAQQRVELTGAGATFPYPLYSKWFDVYAQEKGVRINYQSIGSGGGIRQILERTVDFGATDGPMTDEQLASAAPRKLLHIPTVAGAEAIIYNLEGVRTGMRLSGDVLADIFLGRITRWNDARLVALNPTFRLPNMPIVVAHRSDGSGTTNIFTNYLSKVSPLWKSRVGEGTSVKWPVGVGGKGNEGVAGIVKQQPGAIGYVELAYALQNHLNSALVRNQAGVFVAPSLSATTASVAAYAKQIPPDFRILITNAPGAKTYPITGFTWLLVYQDQQDRVKGEALVRFVWWAIHDGQRYAAPLLYAPLPKEVVQRVERALESITYQGKPILAAGGQ